MMTTALALRSDRTPSNCSRNLQHHQIYGKVDNELLIAAAVIAATVLDMECGAQSEVASRPFRRVKDLHHPPYGSGTNTTLQRCRGVATRADSTQA